MTGAGVDEKVFGWKARAAIWAAGYFLLETISGLMLWLAPAKIPAELLSQLHIWVGLAYLVPATLYVFGHWKWYSQAEGAAPRMKQFGYLATLVVAVCLLTGVVATVTGWMGRGHSLYVDIHLFAALGSIVVVCLHLGVIVVGASRQPELSPVIVAVRGYLWSALLIALLPIVVCLVVGRYF